MLIRTYQPTDKSSCLQVFQSNCPAYFDPLEYALFEAWLDQRKQGTPLYSNSECDYYYVMESEPGTIVGCGGFYLVKDKANAQLSWGMIHADFHKKGLGTALFKYRKEIIEKMDPPISLTLGTSQHTYRFYQKMGMDVTSITAKGYGEHLDKYEMKAL
jgi:[ribosomal protein S18]-alanine N-acetyltransferase